MWPSKNCFAGTLSRRNDYFVVDTGIDNKKLVANSCVPLEPSVSLFLHFAICKIDFCPSVSLLCLLGYQKH